MEPPPPEPGNFTQLFTPKYNEPPPDDLSRRLNRGIEPTPGMGGATGTSMPAQRPPAPGPAQHSPEPGDFTRMFSAPKSANPTAGGGDYTDSLYQRPADGGTALPPSGSGSAAPPPPGGSEYTRALKRVSISDMKPEGGKAAAGAKAPAGRGGDAKAPEGAGAMDEDGERKPNYLPIILIVVGLIVVLVIVVVVFSSLSGL